jgi:hypothetical protein
LPVIPPPTNHHARAVNTAAASSITARAGAVSEQLLPRSSEELKVTTQQPSVPSESSNMLSSSPSCSRISNVGSVRHDMSINPATPCRLISSPRKSKKKWYAVIVGRQTGVFDDWYHALSLGSIISYSASLGFTRIHLFSACPETIISALPRTMRHRSITPQTGMREWLSGQAKRTRQCLVR